MWLDVVIEKKMLGYFINNYIQPHVQIIGLGLYS